MKTLSLVNLYKAEIKRNMLTQIRGGADYKCICSNNNPYNSIKQMGGPVGDLCYCGNTETTSTSVQAKPSVI